LNRRQASPFMYCHIVYTLSWRD